MTGWDKAGRDKKLERRKNITIWNSWDWRNPATLQNTSFPEEQTLSGQEPLQTNVALCNHPWDRPLPTARHFPHEILFLHCLRPWLCSCLVLSPLLILLALFWQAEIAFIDPIYHVDLVSTSWPSCSAFGLKGGVPLFWILPLWLSPLAAPPFSGDPDRYLPKCQFFPYCP